jgi:hypothetical protein
VAPPSPGRVSVSARLETGGLVITLEPAGGATLDDFAAARRKDLRYQRCACGPPVPATAGGYPGVAMTVTPKPGARAGGSALRTRPRWYAERPAGPHVRLYALVGPYSLTVAAGLDQQQALDVAPVIVEPPAPPLMSPVIRLPSVGGQWVDEHLILGEAAVRLTALVSHTSVTGPPGDYARQQISRLQGGRPGLDVGDERPDMFLGGWPCLRVTAVGQDPAGRVRSEYWWVGVANGHGVTIRGSGTKSIIEPDQARRLRDLVVLNSDQ